MTSKLKLAGTAAVLAATLFSCQQNELKAPVAYEATITAIMPEAEPQTKTCVDMSNTGKGYIGLMWQEGDQIGVFGKGTTANALFTNLKSGKSARTDFSGTMTGGDAPYRAYYPYSEANDGAKIDALSGTVLAEQPFNSQTGTLVSDYKYGAPVVGSSTEFAFKHLFSMLRVSVDATGTALAGEKLVSVEISVKDGSGNARAICGSFKFSAVDGSWSGLSATSSSVLMPWSDNPVLNTTLTGFVTVLPTIKSGDKISVTVNTNGHRAQLTADCKVDFEQEKVYNIPLTLSSYAKNPTKYNYSVTEVTVPKFSAFGFTVAANQGKILDKQVYWNTNTSLFQKQGPKTSNVTQLDAKIDGNEITLTIPYLFDFNLTPTFTASSGATVSVNGVVQTSGKTAVDFTHPVKYQLSLGGEVNEYTVKITNTGLPVVVLKQSSTGSLSTEFVDIKMRAKDSDWVEDDQMTIYNADGTVDMATAFCGVRLRGNTSAAYPKKPFAIKFVEKQKVLGMPKHKRWVLLANWLDHSMIRNTVAFDVAHAIEDAWQSGAMDQGIPWNVHGQNVELVVDGRHMGNYVLCEQIKIGGSRLDIQDCYEDVVAAGITPTIDNCGFLFELDTNYDETDKFKTTHYQIPFMFKDPVDGSNGSVFKAVKTKVQRIEDNIYNKKYSDAYTELDINSVIDQWLIWELTMNHEVLDPRSVYFFMDGNGKLSAGPVWDFDRATFQNPTNAKNQGSSGDRVKPYDQWICWSASSSVGYSAFFPQLVNDPIFQAKVKERWSVMYPYLQGVANKIRAYGESQAVSYTYDSAMWPTNKAAIQAHKSGFSDWSGDENISAYSDVIENFVNCYTNRLNGMNTLITTGKFTK